MSLFENCIMCLDVNGTAGDLYNTLTNTGVTYTEDRFGIANRAMETATTKYSTTSSISGINIGTGNYTLNALIKTPSSVVAGYSVDGSVDHGISLYYGGSQLYVGGTSLVSWTPSASTRYLITVVRTGTDTNQHIVYINGVQHATTTNSSSISTEALIIGANSAHDSSSNWSFESCMFNTRAFSAGEVKAYYDLISKKYIYPYQRGERGCE